MPKVQIVGLSRSSVDDGGVNSTLTPNMVAMNGAVQHKDDLQGIP